MTDHKVEATFYDPTDGARQSMLDMIAEIHRTAVSKGWWDGERAMGEILANVHSEVSEAWEEWRDGHPLDEVRWDGYKPEGFPIELADIVIRVMDVCAKYDIDLYKMIQIKMNYNYKRPFRHGGKLA